MEDYEKAAIRSVLQSEIGDIPFYEYEPTKNYVLDQVLEEARSQIGDVFSLYCVDEGLPDIFCLKGFNKSPIIFNSRFVAFSNLIKKLIVDRPYRQQTPLLGQSVALKLIAELALRHGKCEIAVYCIMQSLLIRDVPNELRNYDKHPRKISVINADVDVTYLITWFYGIIHEIGHFERVQDAPYLKGNTFTDQSLRELLEIIICKFPELKLHEIRAEIFDGVNDKGKRSFLYLGNLRNETLTDFFALSVLFKVGLDIRVKQQGRTIYEFLVPFIREITLAQIIISFIDECRQIVMLNEDFKPSEFFLKQKLYSVYMIARATVQKRAIQTHISKLLFGEISSEEHIDSGYRVIEYVKKRADWDEIIAKIRQGKTDALEFCLSLTKGKIDKKLFWQSFHERMMEADPLIIGETAHFIKLAEHLKKESNDITRLKFSLWTGENQLQMRGLFPNHF